MSGALVLSVEPKEQLFRQCLARNPGEFATDRSRRGLHRADARAAARQRCGHLWAETQGYVLLVADDRCATRSPELLRVSLDTSRRLALTGSLTLPSTRWRLAHAPDQRAVLRHELGDRSILGYDSVGGSRSVSIRGTALRLADCRLPSAAFRPWGVAPRGTAQYSQSRE